MVMGSRRGLAYRPDESDGQHADHNNPRHGVEGTDNGATGKGVFRNGDRRLWQDMLNDSNQSQGGNYGQTWQDYRQQHEGHGNDD